MRQERGAEPIYDLVVFAADALEKAGMEAVPEDEWEGRGEYMVTKPDRSGQKVIVTLMTGSRPFIPDQTKYQRYVDSLYDEAERALKRAGMKVRRVGQSITAW